jgi:hypothetical protein
VSAYVVRLESFMLVTKAFIKESNEKVLKVAKIYPFDENITGDNNFPSCCVNYHTETHNNNSGL